MYYNEIQGLETNFTIIFIEIKNLYQNSHPKVEGRR